MKAPSVPYEFWTGIGPVWTMNYSSTLYIARVLGLTPTGKNFAILANEYTGPCVGQYVDGLVPYETYEFSIVLAYKKPNGYVIPRFVVDFNGDQKELSFGNTPELTWVRLSVDFVPTQSTIYVTLNNGFDLLAFMYLWEPSIKRKV